MGQRSGRRTRGAAGTRGGGAAAGQVSTSEREGQERADQAPKVERKARARESCRSRGKRRPVGRTEAGDEDGPGRGRRGAIGTGQGRGDPRTKEA